MGLFATVRHTLRVLWRAARELFHEVTGAVFFILALAALQACWRGWQNGLKVRIELDHTHFVGASPVMFSGVLANFFSLYASVNRFVHTALMRDGREIHAWRPLQGSPLVL